MNKSQALPRETYMDRNGPWIRPFFAAILILLGPALMQIMNATPAWLPAWASTLGGAIGFVFAGFYAVKTNTISALVVRVLANALWLMLIAYLVVKTMAH
ncbi:hypothetical protein CMV24_26560 [Pseudomonas plecoglossicida]|jgi:hypothetical protein|uniref:Uncharacterized protein n=5 Tax=Pseudomonas TaxID=286 RepID=A0A2A3LYB0_PSEDL|nr:MULTISPECIES: hypothetical protein [Pseudomonas]MCT8191610.1 hypothetical protein [Pseudomonas monteilii]TXG99004.1 MAG: hypothetical protein E6R08_03015 [Nevskiaceae bacterium]AGZ38152.1 hypothetical protein PVLB_27077 [Pseudomonas sp. VLB120]MCF3157290.1 hypothetical protein [Pseudomonas juntendi]MDH0760483.1 hypothetical protein [Pseudomonas juntendi]